MKVAAVMLAMVLLSLPTAARAEQASQPSSPAAGQFDAGGAHTCALDDGHVRCWGLGFTGQLGYANKNSIGDDETPGAAGRVDLGPGRSATAISAGDFHTCAVLDNGSVRCWGFGGDGRLGYGNETDIGDDETPGSVGPVNIGVGRTATAISAGGGHTCVILNTGGVLCWGFGEDGRLGYGDTDAPGNDDDAATIGDDEPPGSVAPVQIGDGRTATAITTGREHTCVLLDDQSVRCWGSNGSLFGGDGRLGYGNADRIGDNETPATVGPLSLGAGATAISAGDVHTCAVLVGGSVRCWGNGVDGRNGYGNEFRIGDNELPSAVGPVALGGLATAISAGNHTCARLTSGAVRCWGPGSLGRLGYANTNDIGDDETPATVPAVAVGGPAAAISAGGTHTCSKLDDATLRCWGEGLHGRLGYANVNDVGDNETPATAGAVDIGTPVRIDDAGVGEGSSGATTVTFTVTRAFADDESASVAYATADDSARAPLDYTAASGTLTFAPGDISKTITVQVTGDASDESDERFFVNLFNPSNVSILDSQGTATIVDDDTAPAGGSPDPGAQPPPAPLVDPLAEALRAQARRAAGLRSCRASAASRMRSARTAARRRYRQPRLARILRGISDTAARRRAQCDKRFGRAPGRVTTLVARRASRSSVALTFDAAGSDGSRPPAATGYVVKQSLRPIRTAREFDRARGLCGGTCRFDVTRPGAEISLMVSDLPAGRTYYYAIAARDNVSGRRGPRSRTISARTG